MRQIPPSRGTTIGYAKIDRFPAAVVTHLRLTVYTIATPEQVSITAYPTDV